VPLDVNLVRDRVRWSTRTAAAFRQGIQSLEDHLFGLGIDRAELDVHAREDGGEEVTLHAVLKIGPDRLDVNVGDLDLAYGVTRLFEQLEGEATLDRLFDDGRGPVLGADAPWEEILSTVVATAAHAISRAVDLGDLSPGSVEPNDLADDALATVLEGMDRSMSAVRRALRDELEKRILEQGAEHDDVELDAVAPGAPRASDPNDDDPYAFDEPDETPMRGGDVLDPSSDLADEDRVPTRPDE